MQIQKSDLAKSPIFLVAPFFFLGTAMVAMKFIIPHTSPLFLAAFRLLPAGILTLIVAAALKLPQPKTWKAWLWIGLFALVDGAMFQGLLTTGLVNTGAGLGAVLIDAQPLVVALLARILFGNLIGLWGWLGLAIGIAGISLCGLPEAWIYSLMESGIPLGSWLQSAEGGGWDVAGLLQSGELLMLLSALSMSAGTIIVGYVKRHADPIVATGWHMILGGIPLAVMSVLWETNQVSNLLPGDWLGLGYATVFGTALTYGMFFYLAANGNMTSVSALIFLTPVFALLFSNLFLGEQLTQLQWIGVALTLVSVYLVNQRQQIAAAVANLTRGLGAQSGGTVEVVVPGSDGAEVDAPVD
ncbi:MAG: DMT family transporter [Cyanobacteria bacterium P01_D01_bin.6]